MCGLLNGPYIMRFFLFLCIFVLAPDLFASTVGGSNSGGSSSSYVSNGKTSGSFDSYYCDDQQVPSAVLPDPSSYMCSDGTFPVSSVACPVCKPSSSQGVDSSIPNGSGYCDPATNCQTINYNVLVNGQSQSGGGATNGLVCVVKPAPPNLSNNGTSCPSGWNFVGGTNGCECTDGKGDYTSASGSSGVSVCNGGSATAPTISSGTVPAGTPNSICSNGVCHAVIAKSSNSSTSGGGGGGAPTGSGTPSSSGSGSGSSPSGSSGAGSGTAPTSSTGSGAGSGTAPTSSTGSGAGSNPTAGTGSGTAPTASADSGVFTAPTASFGSSGLAAAVAGMQSSSPFSSIGFGSSWLPQSCPSEPSWTVDLPFGFSQSFNLPTDEICTLAQDLRPFTLAGGVVAALFILAW